MEVGNGKERQVEPLPLIGVEAHNQISKRISGGVEMGGWGNQQAWRHMRSPSLGSLFRGLCVQVLD